MPRCCGGSSCSCVIEEGAHITIAGVGSPADPFVIVGDVDLEVIDNTTFNLTLTGLGTTALPWGIEVGYAPTAKLNDLPDVTAPAPTNAQVLGWDAALGQWTARAPTTAAAGTVTHDTSLTGDGSGGAPLQVQEDPARLLGTTGAGLGLSDGGMNSVVRRFSDSATRAGASPSPVLNSVSMLASNPGQIDFWNGTAWGPAGLFLFSLLGDEMFELSGSYTGAQRVTLMVNNVEDITDSNGGFDAIPSVELAGKAGVIGAFAQPFSTSGTAGIATPFAVVLAPEGSGVRGVAFRLDDGQPMALSPIVCTIMAFVY